MLETELTELNHTGDTPEWAQDAARVGDLFAQIMTRTLALRLLEEMPEAREMELTLPQMHAIHYIWLHRRVLIGALAEGLDISFPSATNMVKRLEEKELLTRVVNPRDRREVEVVLTEQGCNLIEKLETLRLTRFTEFLGRMDVEVRNALIHGLNEFVRLTVGEDARTAEEVCLRCGIRASADCPLADTIPLFACR